MAQDIDGTSQLRRARTIRRVAVAVVTCAAIAGGIALTYRLTRPSGPGADGRVVEGREYWLSVTEAEVAPEPAAGGAWDADHSGPDVQYEIWWRGNRIYQSSAQNDTLLPHWPSEEINLRVLVKKQVLEATRNGGIIAIKPGESVTLKFVDKDLARSDFIAEHSMPTDSLKVGPNVVAAPAGSLRRFVLHVVPVSDGP